MEVQEGCWCGGPVRRSFVHGNREPDARSDFADPSQGEKIRAAAPLAVRADRAAATPGSAARLIAPVPPQVTYQNAQLTIVAPNSTLGDILRAVRKQTGAEIEIPAAPERVVTHLGPGPARAVMAELLNGSRFNYVLLGSPANDALLTRVVLVAKTGPENGNPSDGPSTAEQQQPGMPQPDAAPDANDAEAAADDSTDDAADQAAAEAEQPAAPEQPGVKTPQEMLQEMQQRQMQLQQQQQQQPGQPPIMVAPQRPPQEQQ